MRIIIVLAIGVVLLQACGDGGGESTELEGNWASICVPVLGSSGSPSSPPSPGPLPIVINYPSRVMVSFHGNVTEAKLNIYSGDNCESLSMSILFSDLQYVDPAAIAVTFEIGNVITSGNGVSVKELNFYNADNELLPDIYLLQNNGSTLYLGDKCVPITLQASATCTNQRPIELKYDFYYTRID